MQRVDVERLFKLINKVEHLVFYLDRSIDLAIAQKINHSFYEQKLVELNEMFHQRIKRPEATEIINLINTHSLELFSCWRKDIRWLNRHLHRGRTH